MTPAVNLLKKGKVPFGLHEYEHDPEAASYGTEAAEKMNIPKDRVFKTLIVNLQGKGAAVGILPVSETLNLKKVAQACGVKKAVMAETEEAERITGYLVGGISPLGQKKQLKTVLDISISEHQTIFVSGGRRGLEIELSPEDLISLTRGSCHDIRN